MTTASGSRHTLASIKETVRGTLPADLTLMQLMRLRSTTLALTRATIASEELRSDRQIADFRLGVKSADGNVIGEMSVNTYDDWLAAALCGTWSTNGNGGVLKAGLNRTSFSLLRNFEDINVMELFTAAEINTLAFSVTPGTQVLATFGFMADDMSVLKDQALDDMIEAAADFKPYTTTETLTGLTGGLFEGIAGDSVLGPCTELNINLDNGMNNLTVIGQDHAYDRSVGRSNVTGTATFYFETRRHLDKFVNETTSAIKFSIRDAAGTSGYDILIPKLKYTGAPIPVQNEGPVTIALPYQALVDPALGTNLQITRVLPVTP